MARSSLINTGFSSYRNRGLTGEHGFSRAPGGCPAQVSNIGLSGHDCQGSLRSTRPALDVCMVSWHGTPATVTPYPAVIVKEEVAFSMRRRPGFLKDA